MKENEWKKKEGEKMNSKNERNKKDQRIKNQTKLRQKKSAQDSDSKVTMIDVSAKDETFRVAEAQGRIILSSKTLQLILENKIPKGNVLVAAKLAGIQAAKRTADLLPLCHPLRITSIEVEISPKKKEKSLLVTSRVTALDRTGVEMEALTAVSIACLTIYDMVKALDKRMIISDIHLVSKSGGKSGLFQW